MRFGFVYLRRSLTIWAACLCFLVTFPLVRLRPRAGARYLRWFLERCGGGFAKLGQMLAMRFDLLPRVYQDELTRIFDRMPKVPIARIRRTLREDLGADVFARLTVVDEPIGAASIAQAHVATLDGGDPIILKVRRPDIEHIMRADLVNLGALAWLLQSVGILRNADLDRILREIRRYTDEELDFRREAFNAQALHDRMDADDIDHYAPRPYLELCTPRVVALEKLEGVWMYELVDAIEKRDRARLDAWAADGITPERAARVLYRSALEQAYHHCLFHADPHQGNVLVLRGGTLAYIDFGIVGWLDEPLRDKQERLIRHLTRGEIHGAYNVLLHLIEADTERDLSELESVIKAELTAYLLRARNPHATVAEKSTGRVYVAVATTIGRLRFRLPTRLTRFYRAQMFVDELALTLDPALDPIAEFTAFWTDETARRQREGLCRGIDWNALVALTTALPGVARELADWIRYSLPEIGRSYGETLTRFEHGFLLALQYLRRGVIVAATGAAAFFTWRLLQPGWPRIDDAHRISNAWLLGASAGGFLVAYGLGRIGQRMRTLE